MNNSDIIQQRKLEKETQAYKAFIVIARRLKKIEYDNKWEIVPDTSDPLRKFILQRETPWFKLQIVLKAKEFYHRGDYSDKRYDWRFNIGFKGFYADKAGDITLVSNLEVKPRVVKKLIKCINENLLPNIYKDIMLHDEQFDKARNKEKFFQTQLSKLGLNGPDTFSLYDKDIAPFLAVNPKLNIIARDDSVEINGSMTYDRFAQIAKACGWIK